MPIPDQAALDAIGSAMAKVVPEGWGRAVLKVSAVAATMETQLAVEMLDGSVDGSHSLDAEAQLVCDDLRDAMYEEGAGTWYNAVFLLSPVDGLAAEFDYETPPFDGEASDDLLEDDQRAYPRDVAHLPSWHPSRSDTA